MANAAVVAARCGAEVVARRAASATTRGATGSSSACAAEGVGLHWFARVPGLPTPLAFVVVNEAGEPDFIVYGEGIEAGILSLEDRLEEAIAAHDAVLIGSNTLLGERERALTLRAREIALATGQARPVRPQRAAAPLARRAGGRRA